MYRKNLIINFATHFLPIIYMRKFGFKIPMYPQILTALTINVHKGTICAIKGSLCQPLICTLNLSIEENICNIYILPNGHYKINIVQIYDLSCKSSHSSEDPCKSLLSRILICLLSPNKGLSILGSDKWFSQYENIIILLTMIQFIYLRKDYKGAGNNRWPIKGQLLA